MPTSTEARAVVLAAGLSRRMGSPKALLEFGGRPLVVLVVQRLLQAGCAGPVIVVTGHEAGQVKLALRGMDVVLAHNPRYETDGMLSSIQTGVRALPSGARAFVLTLVDQPPAAAATIEQLIETARKTEAQIILPIYNGKHGHPIVISTACAAEIQALGPTQTLRDVVHRDARRILEVQVDDPAVVMDLDTPQDYQKALSIWRK